MRQIAVVSFGMSDMIIPLLKHFSGHNHDFNVTLFFIYSQDNKKEGIVNFSSVPVNNGFVPAEKLGEVLGSEILEYVNHAFKIEVFIYQSQRFRSLQNLALSIQLAGRLRRYGLIHVNGIGGALLQLIPFLQLKKWMLTVHDYKQHSGEETRWGGKIMAISLKRADHVIIQNQPDYQEIQAHYPELSHKTSFVPFGYLDIYKAFLPKSSNGQIRCDILFFGRISRYKGLEYLLDALEELQQKGLSPSVTIAGGGHYDFGVGRFQALSDVNFINRYIENDELADLICSAKIVVCPYTDATQSGVLMTAFAFNKPVVATDVGGFKDAVVNGVNGFLVPPRQAGPLAAALETLLIDSEKRDEIAQNIQTHKGLPQFRWDQIAQTLRHVYQKFQ